VVYLGKILPGGHHGHLVVYFLQEHGLCRGGGLCAHAHRRGGGGRRMHVWRRNTLLSLFAGTAVSMVLVQQFFKIR
jgi:branched-subunit amino acid transport protein AzlD